MIYLNPYLNISDPKDYILNIPFQNSIADVSGNYTMIAGNGSNAPTFTTGRKGTDYAALFDGTKSIKTNANFVTGTDKFSISLWIKFTEVSAGTIILELGNSASSTSNNWFSLVVIAVGGINRFRIRAKGHEQYVLVSLDVWYHFVCMADLSLSGELEIVLYEGGNKRVLSGTINDQSGNFANAVLHIGQRGGTTLGFKGLIQDLRVYNRVLTHSEILTIYKK